MPRDRAFSEDSFLSTGTNHTTWSPPLLRRLALFVDGMARAMILPFGPTLVYRLVYHIKNETDLQAWAGISPYFAVVVIVYMLGRSLGSGLATRVGKPTSTSLSTTTTTTATTTTEEISLLPRYVARLGGAAVSLHIFTYGAGLKSVGWLVWIRFLSAAVSGWMCAWTDHLWLPEDKWALRRTGWDVEDELVARRRETYIDIASGTAKLYMTGFCLSILTGGLLFRKATKDHVFQALTGADQYTWSPLFLIGVAVLTEVALRIIFSRLAQQQSSARKSARKNSRLSARSSTPLQASIFEEEDFSETNDAPSVLDENAFLDPLTTTAMSPRKLSDGTSTLRNRGVSDFSMDDFFDCRSNLSDAEDVWEPTGVADVTINDSEKCVYRNYKCVYPSDNTPCYCTPGNAAREVPANFVAFFHGNHERASKAWHATQQWRRDKHVWKIHTQPHEWYGRIKEAYPHFIHGYSKAGFPVVYEQPGKMRLKELFRSGCKIDDMLFHYKFFIEYMANNLSFQDECRNLLCPNSERLETSKWGFMVVMDVKGAGLSNLSGEVIMYLKQAGDINSAHYPLSIKRAFVVNAPFWLAGAWSGLKGILPDTVQVDLLSESKYPNALKEFIDEEQIPPEYGGTSPYKLGEHPYEIAMQELAESQERLLADDAEATTSFPPPIITTALSPTSPTTRGMNGGNITPIKTPSRSRPVRRRIGSVGRVRINSGVAVDAEKGAAVSTREILIAVSILHTIWSAVQGAIEFSVPLWVLAPPRVGGLGYSPSRSGVCMFCASLSLMWTMRKKQSRMVAQIPSKYPMRAFRIGVGSEAALLSLLALTTRSTTPEKRRESVFVMTSVILIFACLALASMCGRSASKILHRTAAEGFARAAVTSNNVVVRVYGANNLLMDCQSGRFTTLLTIIGQVVGIVVMVPLWSWSVRNGLSAPWNGTSVLFVGSFVSLVLYIFSFTLYLNVAGDFAPRPRDSCSSEGRKCAPFLKEIFAAAAGDMASLFEESNWSATTPLLQRGRTWSESSARAEHMERGDEFDKEMMHAGKGE